MRLFARHFHHHGDPWAEAPAWAVELREMLGLIITKENRIMSSMDDLAASVAAEDTVIDGAVALINGFAAQLTAAGADPAKLNALSADITAKSAALAAAVLANTPTATPGAAPVTPAVAAAAAASAQPGA